MNMISKRITIFSTCFAAAAACLLSARLSSDSTTGPKSFGSPREAADAIVQACAADDASALLAIFGPDGKSLVASGNSVQDKKDRAWFAKKAKEKLQVEADPTDPHRAMLLLGKDGWPMPVPIVVAAPLSQRSTFTTVAAKAVEAITISARPALKATADCLKRDIIDSPDRAGVPTGSLSNCALIKRNWPCRSLT